LLLGTKQMPGDISMKKLLWATTALVVMAMAAPASAADMAARRYAKAPPMTPMYDWSGFYLGANGGWGSNRDCRTDSVVGTAFGCHNATGGVAGGQAGYRWQTGAWVFGLEAQGDWASLTGTNQSLASALFTVRSKMDAFGLFTGQVGYAWNNALIYVKGGAAVTDTRYDTIANATNAVVGSAGYNTNWGATAGAGLEYGFAPNWSAAVEYDHIFQSTGTFRFVTPAGASIGNPLRDGGDTDLVTVRLNYRWGGPLIARY
jgi:outer membrane immunogenic protein